MSPNPIHTTEQEFENQTYHEIHDSVMVEPLPTWFDDQLLPFFLKRRIEGLMLDKYEEKVRLTKNFSTLGLRIVSRLTWARACELLQSAIPRHVNVNDVDVILGLKSGGAFIANALKYNKFPSADVQYIKICRQNGLHTNLSLGDPSIWHAKMSTLSTQKSVSRVMTTELPDPERFRKKRVVVVDDFAGTGSSLLAALSFVRSCDPLDVHVVVLGGTRPERDDVVTWQVPKEEYSTRYLVTPWGFDC
jgi:hypoxanthine phosphoribosyltransferase